MSVLPPAVMPKATDDASTDTQSEDAYLDVLLEGKQASSELVRAARTTRSASSAASVASAPETHALLRKLGDAAHLDYDADAVMYFALRTAFVATCTELGATSTTDAAWSDKFFAHLDVDKRFNVLLLGLETHPEDSNAFVAHYDECMSTMVTLRKP